MGKKSVIARSGTTKQSLGYEIEIAAHLSGSRNDKILAFERCVIPESMLSIYKFPPSLTCHLLPTVYHPPSFYDAFGNSLKTFHVFRMSMAL
jgi:hypothetical protein